MPKVVTQSVPEPPRVLNRVHSAIVKRLGIDIVTGLLRPGEVIEGELASSKEMGVSRTAYREALRYLAAKGLVTSKPKVGTTVRAMEQWHLLDAEVLSWMLDEGNLRNLHGLLELCAIVEPAAAALAAVRRSATQLEALQDSTECMARLTLASEAGRQANRDFHAAVVEASGNPYLISMTDGIKAAAMARSLLKLHDRTASRVSSHDHARVIEAIVDRNAENARQYMTKLVELPRPPSLPPGVQGRGSGIDCLLSVHSKS